MVSTFVRTFGQLFAPYVLLAVTAAQLNDYNLTVTQIVVGATMATVGGLLAVLTAIRWGVETDRLKKSLRSAAQAAVTVLGAVAVNSIADVFILPRVLIPGAIGVLGAFVVTYLSYPADETLEPAAPPAPAG